VERVETPLSRTIGDIKAKLFARIDQIKTLSTGTRLDPARLCTMAVNSIVKNPKLAECDQGSFLLSVLQAAECGLDLGATHQASLIPRKNKVALQIEFRGYIDLARRSGEISDIWAEVVYDGDVYTVTKGLHRDLVHVPSVKEDRLDQRIIACYACAQMKDGTLTFVDLTTPQVYKHHRSKSVAYQQAVQYGKTDTPWMTDEAAMMKKTAIVALCKYLPASVIDMRRAAAIEEAEELGQSPVLDGIDMSAARLVEEPAIVEGEIVPPQSTSEAVRGKVAAKAAKKPAEATKPAPEPSQPALTLAQGEGQVYAKAWEPSDLSETDSEQYEQYHYRCIEKDGPGPGASNSAWNLMNEHLLAEGRVQA
jgi:recombination protein RecT